ncbi:MAG: sodium:calcium antiporter [Candidatus Moranbacteria bacterium]|nr:sodium:calcium antiporter [Candidatus Moranbacteria bacterium]
MINHILIYVLSFAGVWIGSGIIIKSVERLSRALKISCFTISFLVLGFFTSITEFSVGINSILTNDPEIYVGNLIGGCIVVFMLIIPLLAITGSKIRVNAELRGFNLPASLTVISLSVVLAMDGRIDRIDALISLAFFASLIIAIQLKRGILEKIKNVNPGLVTRTSREFLRISFGIATIFIASRFIVEQTLHFSQIFNLSPFLISLLVIGVGTNIPELSFVVRSVFMKSNQIAFGNYVGSASFNTFLLGILTLINGEAVILTNSYLVSLLFLVVGLLAFYHFARTKNTISRREGLVLFAFYLLFLVTEIYIHKEFLLPIISE